MRCPVRTWFSEHQAAEHPPALDRLLDVRGEIGDRRGATREPVEGLRHVTREPARIDLELADDEVQVRALLLQDLVEPVHQLDVRVAAKLAEHGGALDRLVREGVELAEQRYTGDFRHGPLLLLPT